MLSCGLSPPRAAFGALSGSSARALLWLTLVIVVLAADELKLDPIVLPAVAGLPTKGV